jgi:hypothetical protein
MPRLYRCLRRGQVRAGATLDTARVGELEAGAEIIALQSCVLPSGVERVQFDAGSPAGWVSRTVSGRGRIARSIPILQDLGELDALLGGGAATQPSSSTLSLKDKMTLSLLASGEVAPAVVEDSAEAAARSELERLAAQGVVGAEEALAALGSEADAGMVAAEEEQEKELGGTVFMSIDDHQAACAREKETEEEDGYQVSDEEDDPLGGFDSSGEEDEGYDGSSCRHSMHQPRASSGRQSMRMSMAFTPSKSGGNLLAGSSSSDDEGEGVPDSRASPSAAAVPQDDEAYVSSSDDEVRTHARAPTCPAAAAIVIRDGV